MRDPNSGSVQLLKVDPELARGLDAPRAREASERLYTRAIDVPRGRWTPQPRPTGGSEPIGLLVLEGLLVREATVSNHPCAELLGPGDLMRAWDDGDADELLPRRVDWAAATSARIAIVDQALAVRMAQWPEIFAALMDRAARRAERLVVTQAIAHITRVDERLLALLWLLAERWGRVVPGGVLVSLRLPHRTLAGMVGARRPSVTTALGQLMARGAIERRQDGAWILRDQPPGEERLEATTRPCSSRRAASAFRARAPEVRPSIAERVRALAELLPAGISRLACSRSSERPTVSAAATRPLVEVEDRELAVVEGAADDLAVPASAGPTYSSVHQSARSDQK